MKSNRGLVLSLLIVLTLSCLTGCRRDNPTRVISGEIEELAFALGTVQARQQFRYRAAVPGQVVRLYVEEGDIVSRNQALVELDSIPVIRSTIHGVVSQLPYSEGELVNPQTSVVVVTGVEGRYLLLGMEEQSVIRVHAGQSAKVRFSALGDESRTGTVHKIYPAQGQFFVHVEVSDLPATILPGMTADVAITVGHRKDALLVPRGSIKDGKLPLLRNGRREWVNAKKGLESETLVEVTGDSIHAGDEIAAD